MKIVKNTTGSPITINDVGLRIPANSSYTIYPNEYPLWAASLNIDTHINSGAIVVNDGYDDLKPANGLLHIHNEGIHRQGMFSAATSLWTVSGVTIVLDKDSRPQHMFTGSDSGQNVNMGDARQYNIGHRYEIFNKSLYPIVLLYGDGSAFYNLPADAMAHITLKANGDLNGEWLVIASGIADINILNPDFSSTKVGFEDFLFDAYAGNSGNDNQYAFTPEANLGLSTIDGAIPVVGNDYEGIHILNSNILATSRPLLSAFNSVNRIKLGAQIESFEIRIRIEQLATLAQKFTCRYGLMDVSTTGLPANGVIFSYQPIYPVTPVAQVVTVTPNVTSQAPTQVFTETLNGTPYTYTYQTYDIDTYTPNAFPVATFQRISITWTRTNNQTYTVVINGITCSYTSDATATDAEISLGLSNAINTNVGATVTATNAKPIVVTSDVLGQEFTYSGTNVTITLVTANVAVAVYTVTIASRPIYSFTSDGTPTASEVVAGLIAFINADALCPMVASGTTVLTLTGKVLGEEVITSSSSNLTFSETTPSTTALAVCNAIRALINADGPLPITASGTTTLILTADIPGTAFTYSGTANLTQILTTANVPEVLYKGTWIASVINGSTATNLDTEIPIVANQWYRLKCVVNALGTQVYVYIDSVYIGAITIGVPLVAMRYIFKLEKTLGTQSRTTSIDYITWRRSRG
jgi:hypothetical protein